MRREGLGAGFARLWAAAVVSGLGDGMHQPAVALLAASLTGDPLLVALVLPAEFLPRLLVGLPSGALVDRWDRRRVLWIADLARFGLVALLAVAAFGGWATLPLVLAVAFGLGVGATFFDSAVQAMIPLTVSRQEDRLARANGRLSGGEVVGRQFLGPPAGGALFALAGWLPFAANAVSFAGSSVLVARLPADRPAAGAAAGRGSLRGEVVDGVRWLFGRPLLRTFALSGAAANFALAAGTGVLVLYARRLGVGAAAYGLLFVPAALAAVLASAAAGRLARRVGSARCIVAAWWVLAAAQAVTAAAWTPAVLAAGLAATGAAVTLSNVLSGAIRQSIVPARMMGRNVAAGRTLALGAMPLGAVAGGLLAGSLGLRAPYLAATALLAVVAAAVSRLVTEPAIATARATAAMVMD